MKRFRRLEEGPAGAEGSLEQRSAGEVGCGFLVELCSDRPSFTPEDLTPQTVELAAAARRFSVREALSVSDRIEEKEPGLMDSLLAKSGALGLFSAEIPVAHGGLGLGTVEAAAIAENVAHQGSFVVSFLCHAGIGTYPVLAFGTEAQKQRWLPGLASGETIGAFGLTEAEAGSDALAVRTRAVLSPDKKHYILSGEKLYCTNAACAGLYTIFARTDAGFTAFIVERSTPGLSIGNEEEKMGIHGSSTASVILNDARISVENLLGEEGKGHRVAFNTLNVGRMKLGAACVGTAKRLVGEMAAHANERRQFGRAIGTFELVRQKIARSAARAHLAESMIYRLAGSLASGPGAVEEHSIEAAMAKVYCSEAIGSIADEAVAIFGGSGYIRGYSPEGAYRDCRIDRIFEGTNEICRLYISSALIKRAMSGRLPLMARLGEILSGLKSGLPKTDPSRPFAALVDGVEGLKRASVYLAGVALKKFGDRIQEKQATLAAVADLTTEAYAFDSGVARAAALWRRGDSARAERQSILCGALLSERMPALLSVARQSLINVAGGDEAEFGAYLKALSRIAELPACDTDAAWSSVASRILEKETYEP